MQLKYRQTSNIRRTLVGNELADHPDIVQRCPNYIFILDLTHDFNGAMKTIAIWDEKHLGFGILCVLY